MKRLLLVDDFKMIRVAFKDYLEDVKEFQITEDVANGKEALEQLEKNEYDLLITDISMPEMDGIELIDHVNEKYPDLKILVLTMYQDQEVINECLNRNIKGYLAKNSERAKVLECISTILKGDEYWDEEIEGLNKIKP